MGLDVLDRFDGVGVEVRIFEVFDESRVINGLWHGSPRGERYSMGDAIDEHMVHGLSGIGAKEGTKGRNAKTQRPLRKGEKTTVTTS